MNDADEIKATLMAADMALDVALPAIGHAELVPLADLVTRILEKLTAAVTAKAAAAPVLQAEIAAADAAADALEKAEFPPPAPTAETPPKS